MEVRQRKLPSMGGAVHWWGLQLVGSCGKWNCALRRQSFTNQCGVRKPQYSLCSSRQHHFHLKKHGLVLPLQLRAFYSRKDQTLPNPCFSFCFIFHPAFRDHQSYIKVVICSQEVILKEVKEDEEEAEEEEEEEEERRNEQKKNERLKKVSSSLLFIFVHSSLLSPLLLFSPLPFPQDL